MKGECVQARGWFLAGVALIALGGVCAHAAAKKASSSVGTGAVVAVTEQAIAGGCGAPGRTCKLPVSGSVVVRDRGGDSSDVIIRDSASGREVVFVTLTRVWDVDPAYVHGSVFLLRPRYSAGTRKVSAVEIWRFGVSGKGVLLYTGSTSPYRVSACGKYVAVNDTHAICVVAADGSGTVRQVSNKELIGSDARDISTVGLEGWNRTSTELWYSVNGLAEGEDYIQGFGCISLPSWQITTYPDKARIGGRYAFNPNSRQAAYYADAPDLGDDAAEIWVYDLATHKSTWIGSTLLGGENPAWKDDSTVVVTNSQTGRQYLFPVHKP